MDYEQALAFWTSRINFEERAPARDELKLAPQDTMNGETSHEDHLRHDQRTNAEYEPALERGP